MTRHCGRRSKRPSLTIQAVKLKRPPPLKPHVWGNARNVLISICERANPHKRAWPSIATLADDTGLCERAVRVGLRTLEQLGWIHLEIPARRYSTQVWSIHLPQPDPAIKKTRSDQGQGLQDGTPGVSIWNPIPYIDPLHSNYQDLDRSDHFGTSQHLKEQRAQKNQPVENSPRLAKEQRAARPRRAPPPHEAQLRDRAKRAPAKDGNYRVMVRLGHYLLHRDGGVETLADDGLLNGLGDLLKDLCARHAIRYDSGTIAKAVDTVLATHQWDRPQC